MINELHRVTLENCFLFVFMEIVAVALKVDDVIVESGEEN